MSETPRTDAQYKEYARRENQVKCVEIDFARQLERELNEANKEREFFKSCTADDWRNAVAERDQLRAENKRLLHLIESDWTAPICDRINSLLREYPICCECKTGQEAARAVSDIHGYLGSLFGKVDKAEQQLAAHNERVKEKQTT